MGNQNSRESNGDIIMQLIETTYEVKQSQYQNIQKHIPFDHETATSVLVSIRMSVEEFNRTFRRTNGEAWEKTLKVLAMANQRK
jgi:hypothetical protein